MHSCDPTLAKIESSPSVDPSSDVELLSRFAKNRSESAFKELVRRHGPMVMGVCRRVLANRHDAEDAFQTTFLVLAQKSSYVRRPELLANWLYGVAFRSAKKVKHSKPQWSAINVAESEMAKSPMDMAFCELQSVIDEELYQMPDRERTLLTLRYFQGLTYGQIADRLGWRRGSVSRRLAKARQLLRARLARRGLALSFGLLTLLMSRIGASPPVSAGLIESTAKASSAALEPASRIITAQQAASTWRGVGFSSMSLAGAAALLLLLLGPCGLLTDNSAPASVETTAPNVHGAAVAPNQFMPEQSFVGPETASGRFPCGCH